MKTKFLLLGFLVFSLIQMLKGQEGKRPFVFVEGGIDFISCESPEKDYIRGDIDPYNYGYVTDQLRSLLHAEYLGVKLEYRLLNNVIGASGGLRYTRMISSIGKTSYWSDTPDFFYVMYKQEGLTTEYAKVREMIQKTDYVGIPLEFRIYPNKDWMVNIYYKLGAALNIKVRNKKEAVFYSDAMKSYSDEVNRVTENPGPFHASLFAGVGLKLGKLTKPGGNLEITFPVGILPSGEPGFVTPEAGGGCQVMFRIPL